MYYVGWYIKNYKTSMIPLTLHIKNFLSYGPEIQIIDFGPYPLICLSGKNGHGKSALLDAITWALWGQARKTLNMVKPDQGLLRLGQTHMMVIFDFELGGSAYRVRREFSIMYGKQSTHLEFGMLNRETEKLIPLTSKTIRSTQDIIEQTIHIDFDSFTNSAFLRQGNANEFSKKSSKDRKEILASILGLGQYDILRKRAMEKARAAAVEKQTLLMLQEKLVTELQKKEFLAAQLDQVTNRLVDCIATEQVLHNQAMRIEHEEKKRAQESQDVSLIAYKIEELLKKQHEDQVVLREKYTTWRSIHKKQLRMSNYAGLQSQKKEIACAIDLFQKKFQQHLNMQKQCLEYGVSLQSHIQQSMQKHALLEQKVLIEIESMRIELKNIREKKVYAQEQKKLLEQEIEQYQRFLKNEVSADMDVVEAQLIKEEHIFERRKEYYQNFRARGSLIHNELQSSTQKKQLVHDEKDPSCPLCEQNLSASRRRFLQQKFNRNEQFLTHQRTRLVRVVKKLKDMLVEQHTQIQRLRVIVQEQNARKLQQAENAKHTAKVEASLALIVQQVIACEQKELDMDKKLEKIEVYARTLDQVKKDNLANDLVYQQLTTILKTLEYELATIDYNSGAHQEAQERLQEIEKQLFEYEHIQQELLHQVQRKKDILLLCHTLRSMKLQVEDLVKARAVYSDLTRKIMLLEEEKIKLADERKKCMQEKEFMLQEKGSIITQQEKLGLLEGEQVANQRKIKECDEAMVDYHAIAVATGRDGIQALLIEDAIPEIEQEANELLKKLTNNQAQIFIESLRDLKKGGTKETLDINISDATGIRPYELFSGGEAFRIDFALRIAISKLLARRAGTALQTLIIDEGFGSQDEEGLSHIMDALHIIQNDFSKVIIVSHLNAMKDQFPVHFVVEKGAQGSTVTVIEQD